ncbi:hypothetical protein VKT23_015208 [Stygiomarasmius scandens]|uniref:Uncharacterized protein n=1 Tax=Marasmiellus scandens TaxID=2682957 RepID=A0ABR1IYA1_9AGAR
MLLPSQCFVVLGLKNGNPSPGIYSTMQWRRGGFSAPLFPLAIQCTNAEQAELIYSSLQPWISENFDPKKPHDIGLSELFALEIFETICAELNSTLSLFWVVRMGKVPGIYFDGTQAWQSVEGESQSMFRRAFGFQRFQEAVNAMAFNEKAPAGLLFDYDPHGKRDSVATQRAQAAMQSNKETEESQPQDSVPEDENQLPRPHTPTASRSWSEWSSRHTPTPQSSSRGTPHSTPARSLNNNPTPRSNRTRNTPDTRFQRRQPSPESPLRSRINSPMPNVSVTVSPQIDITTQRSPEPPTLGIDWPSHYLKSHRYSKSEISAILSALSECENKREFVRRISRAGSELMDKNSAQFLWDMHEYL